MFALLGLFAGPTGKLLRYGALALAVVAGGWFLLHQHDARVRAEAQLSAQAARLSALMADHKRVVAALEAESTAAAARVRALETTRKAVYASPRTTGCADSPAVRAALDGLRKPPANGARTPN